MIGKYKVTLRSDGKSAEYVLTYDENEAPAREEKSGDVSEFLRKDGSVVSFAEVHMDKLHKTVQDWTTEVGTEGEVEELTKE